MLFRSIMCGSELVAIYETAESAVRWLQDEDIHPSNDRYGWRSDDGVEYKLVAVPLNK